MLASTNYAAMVVPALVCLSIIAVCLTVFVVQTWNVEPWTRKYLKPHKQLRMDRYRVRIMKLRAKHPEVFAEPSPFREQHFDIGDAAHAIEDVVTNEGETHE